MRLIDADALIEEIAKTADLRTLSTKTIGEAIDRVPQKTEKWIKHCYNGIEDIECSCCGCWFLHDHLVRNSYCPNCGSKMEWR